MTRFLAGNLHGAGSTPGGYSDDDEPGLANARGELSVRRGIVAVDPAAEDTDRRSSGFERAAVRLAVDAAGEPADDDEPGGRELPPQHAGDLRSVRRAGAGSDDGDCRPAQQLHLRRSAHEQARRADRGSSGAAAGTREPCGSTT